MRATRRLDPRTILSALLLLTSIALSMLWQAQGRMHQRMDIGAASDDGGMPRLPRKPAVDRPWD